MSIESLSWFDTHFFFLVSLARFLFLPLPTTLRARATERQIQRDRDADRDRESNIVDVRAGCCGPNSPGFPFFYTCDVATTREMYLASSADGRVSAEADDEFLDTWTKVPCSRADRVQVGICGKFCVFNGVFCVSMLLLYFFCLSNVTTR